MDGDPSASTVRPQLWNIIEFMQVSLEQSSSATRVQWNIHPSQTPMSRLLVKLIGTGFVHHFVFLVGFWVCLFACLLFETGVLYLVLAALELNL